MSVEKKQKVLFLVFGARGHNNGEKLDELYREQKTLNKNKKSI